MHQKTLLVVLAWFLSSASYALKFNYDNYSDIAGLKYSFSFNGQDWITPDVFGTSSPAILDHRNMGAVKFAQLPKAWKIEAPKQANWHCWDENDQQKTFNNVLVLKQAKFSHKNDLLLDVIDYEQGITVRITDMDGNGEYSNVLICRPE